jgi:hypothetical protein
MAGRLNWQKANQDRRMREQGISPHEDLLPRHPEGDRLSRKGNLIVETTATKKATQKVRSKAKRSRNTKARYLEAVVSAFVRGEPQPKPFKKLTQSELQEINGYQSRLDWARAQSGFAELESRARAKLNKKGKRNPSLSKPKTPGGATPEINGADRIKFLRSEIAQAQQFIRAAEAEIAKLLKE